MNRQTVFIGMTPTLRLRLETTIENLLGLLDREGDDEREAIDEREQDHGDYDGIGTIMGGQGL